MATVKCFHCGAEGDPERSAGYCEECGKKLLLTRETVPVSGQHSARARILAQMEKQGSPEWNVRLTGLLFIGGGLFFGLLLLMALTHRGMVDAPVVRRVVVGSLLVVCLALVLGGLFLVVRGKAAADD